jgi:hypothetical protein
VSALITRIREKNETLICIGAGKMLKDYFAYNSDFQKTVSVIADNFNKSELCGFPVVSVEEAVKNPKTMVIVITCNAFLEICEQLCNIGIPDNVDCYILQFMLHLPEEYVFPMSASKIKIPKKIHYVWLGGKDIPYQNKVWMESWNKYCPDYEIIRWDESNYDVTKNKYMYEAYKSGKYAFASDYARIDVVYNNGGVYFDNDVELLANIDELLCYDSFCGLSYSSGNNTGVGFGAGFGSIRCSKMLNEMLDVYNNYTFIKEDGNFDLRNCDYYQGIVLKKYGFEPKNSVQVLSGMVVFPTDVFCPMDYLGNLTALTSHTKSIHHFDASWFDDNDIKNRKSVLSKIKNFHNKHFIKL